MENYAASTILPRRCPFELLTLGLQNSLDGQRFFSIKDVKKCLNDFFAETSLEFYALRWQESSRSK